MISMTHVSNDTINEKMNDVPINKKKIELKRKNKIENKIENNMEIKIENKMETNNENIDQKYKEILTYLLAIDYKYDNNLEIYILNWVSEIFDILINGNVLSQIDDIDNFGFLALFKGIKLFNNKKYPKMKEQLLLAVQKKNHYAMCFFGMYFEKIEKRTQSKRMIMYYEMAINYGNIDAIDYLGNYYYKNCKYDLMKNYFEYATTNPNAMYKMAMYYKKLQNYETMENYFIEATLLDNIEAMCDLAKYYQENNNELDAIVYYEMAHEKNCIQATLKLIDIYKKNITENSFAKLATYYNCLIEKDPQYATQFGKYLYNKKKYVLAEYYYLIAMNYINCHHTTKALGDCYRHTNKFEFMEKYYIIAIENGNMHAITALIKYYKAIQKNELILKYYVLAIQAGISGIKREVIKYFKNNETVIYYELIKLNNQNQITQDIIALLKPIVINKEGILGECIICYESTTCYYVTKACKSHSVCKLCFSKLKECPYKCNGEKLRI